MTLKRHPISGDPILSAHERAERPNAFGDDGGDALCPFCPGNEALTPPSIAELGQPWRARVFPNKYPAAAGHEVIVESPDHDATFDRVSDAAAVVKLSLERYEAHRDAAHVAWFKNHGAGGGASIPHLHSQLLPLSFVPPRIAREAEALAASCVLCEEPRSELLIRETASFRWLAPRAATFAHQTSIVPKSHANEPSLADAEELAVLLQAATKAMLGVATSQNWSLIAFRNEPRAHWYVDLFPRTTAIAGFELGTGTHIEIVDPADTAARFRR